MQSCHLQPILVLDDGLFHVHNAVSPFYRAIFLMKLADYEGTLLPAV